MDITRSKHDIKVRMTIIDQYSNAYHIVTYLLTAQNQNVVVNCRASLHISLKLELHVSLKLEVHRHAQNMLTNLSSIIKMIGGGPMQSLNAHEHLPSTNHETNAYGHDLDMLIILHFVSYDK